MKITTIVLYIIALIPCLVIAMKKPQDSDSILCKRNAQEQELDAQWLLKKPKITESHTTVLPASNNSKEEYKCSYCNYSAQNNSNLIAHTRIHTGEKPFKCTYPNCTFAAKQKNNLKIHLRTHMGEKSFKCTYACCNYAAARKDVLINHMKTHTTQKLFNCFYEGCDFATIQKDHLIYHLKTHISDKSFTAFNELTPVDTPLPTLFEEPEQEKNREE